MALYCYKCKSCGATKEDVHRRHPLCRCGTTMIRDYRAEQAVVHIPAYMKTANTSSRDDFLPTAKDFEKPGDADGSKGMKHWKDTHQLKGSRWI